jgi:hypothetical protein
MTYCAVRKLEMCEQDYARQIRIEDLEGLDDSWSDDSVGDGCGTAR